MQLQFILFLFIADGCFVEQKIVMIVAEMYFHHQYTCEEQAYMKKCDREWMKGYCCKSCNKCGINNDTFCGDKCFDVTPSQSLCKYQIRDRKKSRMNGFCCKSCANRQKCNNESIDSSFQPIQNKTMLKTMDKTNINNDDNDNQLNSFLFVTAIVVFVLFVTVIGVIVVIYVKIKTNFWNQTWTKSYLKTISDIVLHQNKLSLSQLNIICPTDQGSTSCVRFAHYEKSFWIFKHNN